MGKDFVLLGAGGHARVLLEALKQLGLFALIRGVLAPEMTDWQNNRLGLSWLGGDHALAGFSPLETQLLLGIGAIGVTETRSRVFEQNRMSGFEFASVIHPGAMVAADVVLGEGVQIMARSVVQTGSILADNVLINTGAIVDHDCELDAHVHIASGAVLSGGVRVGRETFVGAGAVVRQGITIGRKVVVGAGAVVVREVRDGTVVVGCPAKEITK
ncbi:MAG: NeuD/PglB/VioB family sugar acetyltransferase [Magnetococcus sp. YQC-5]